MRGELTSEQCESVIMQVIDMFEECGIHTLPIDPFAIAAKLHYILVPYSALSLEYLRYALLISSDAFSRVEQILVNGICMYRYVIYYNDRKYAPRIRWTLLHEIGHCYLGHHDHPDESLNSVEEAEANLFAKYSAAPLPLINMMRDQSVAAIAHLFSISYQAATYAQEYFYKWLQWGPDDYTDYEIRLLELFDVAA